VIVEGEEYGRTDEKREARDCLTKAADLPPFR